MLVNGTLTVFIVTVLNIVHTIVSSLKGSFFNNKISQLPVILFCTFTHSLCLYICSYHYSINFYVLFLSKYIFYQKHTLHNYTHIHNITMLQSASFGVKLGDQDKTGRSIQSLLQLCGESKLVITGTMTFRFYVPLILMKLQ